MLLLNRGEIESCFSMNDAIDAVQRAFEESYLGNIETPLRTVIPTQKGVFLFMSAYMENLGYAILKVVNIFSSNYEQGLPTAPSSIILFDGQTGIPLAYLDGTYVTQLRTGGATGVAFKHLAKKHTPVGAIIGAGGLAEMQIEAMLSVRNVEEVRITDSKVSRAEILAQRMRNRFPDKKFCAVENSDEAIKGADLIITATSSKKPTFAALHVSNGVTVSAVGSFRPDMQEIDPAFLRIVDKVFCDSKQAVMKEAGDILIPMQKGDFSPDSFIEDLARVLTGSICGRINDEEIILFETVGFAAEDLITSAMIYERAKIMGCGISWSASE